VAAVGLLLFSVVGIFSTGYNRFFAGDGGRNLIMAFSIVWASTRIVIATFHLQSCRDSESKDCEATPNGCQESHEVPYWVKPYDEPDACEKQNGNISEGQNKSLKLGKNLTSSVKKTPQFLVVQSEKSTEKNNREKTEDAEATILCGLTGCFGIVGENGLCRKCGRESARKPAKSLFKKKANITDNQPDFQHKMPIRTLCNDGNCIGIIGENGCCNECGKEFTVDQTQETNRIKKTSIGTLTLCGNDKCIGVIGEDGKCKKYNEIRVIRPALNASLIAFILGISTAIKPLGADYGAGYFASSLVVGVMQSVLAFLVVSAWQGFRRYVTKSTTGETSKKFIPDLFSAIASEQDALAVVKGYGWYMAIMSGITAALQICVGEIWAGIVEVVLSIGLILIVFRLKSRVAAVGLLLFSVVGIFSTGYNRFFAGDGGRNLILAFPLVWASTRLVIATYYIQSCRDHENLPEADPNNRCLLSWKTLKTTILIAVILCVFIFIAILQYKKVAESGTSKDVIDLLTRYQNSLKVTNSPKNSGEEFDFSKPYTVVSSPEWSVAVWQNKALEFEEKKDWPGLLEHTLFWTQAQPKDALAWNNLGNAYGKSNQPAKAIEAYKQALRINPEDADAWNNLGVAYKIAGQDSKAMEVYKRLKTLDPAMADRLFNIIIMP
jgi:hypothetical protein